MWSFCVPIQSKKEFRNYQATSLHSACKIFRLAWYAVRGGDGPRQGGEAGAQGGQPRRGRGQEGLADVLQVAAFCV